MRVRDRCCETSTTTGTGDFTLSGTSPAGYRILPDLALIPYLIEAVDDAGTPTGQWETGLGYVDTGVLTRNIAIDSFEDGSETLPVDFAAGTKRVWLSYNTFMTLPWVMTFTGSDTLTGTAAGQVQVPITSTDTNYAVTFAQTAANGVKIKDTPALWFTVIDVSVVVVLESTTLDEWVTVFVKNNGSYLGEQQVKIIDNSYQVVNLQLGQPVFISGAANDIEVFVRAETSTSLDATAKVTVRPNY